MEGMTDILGKKIAALCTRLKTVQADNSRLAEENARLSVRVKELEKVLDKDLKRVEQLDQERTGVKTAIDELVQSIDTFMNKER